MSRKKRKKDVGRVDFRAIMENRSSRFGDKRTKRARTRGEARRRALEDGEW